MTADETDPVALTPDSRPDRDLRVKLNAHLEITFETWFRDGIGAGRGGIALKTVDHGVKISLFGRLDGSGYGGTVNSFMEDGIIGVVFFHRAEVVGTFEKVRTLATCIFGAYGLAVNALRRETLSRYKDGRRIPLRGRWMKVRGM